MSATSIFLYLSIPTSFWVAFSISWLTKTQQSTITDIAMVVGSFPVITGPFWFFFVVYLLKTLVPRLDKIAQHRQTSGSAYPDNWLTRSISLNNYAGNLVSARVRRKQKLPIDLEQQPVEIRLALRIHAYWMCLGGLALLIDFLLTVLA